MVAGFHLDPGAVAALAAGTTMLAVAAFLMVLDVENRVHRALALFLFLRGLQEGLFVFTTSVDDLGFRLRGYLFIAVPFAAIHFAYVYHVRYGRRLVGAWERWPVSVLLLVVAAALEIAYFNDHAVLRQGDQPGPLQFMAFAPVPMYAFLALMFARSFASSRVGQKRKAFLAGAVGLSVQPFFYALFRIVDAGFDAAARNPLISVPFTVAELMAYLATLVFVSGVILLILRGPTSVQEPARPRLIFLWSLTATSALVTAVLFAALPPRNPATFYTLQVLNFTWAALLPILVAYALVKHRLFDAEVKLRFAIKGTTLAAIFLAVFFIVNKVTENVVASRFENDNVGIYVGGAVAGLLLFALAPLQRVADRLAHRAVPDSGAAHGTEAERFQLFREQLEIAWGDGRLTPKERLLFARLQERLGIPADEATRLETEVVSRLQPRRRVAVG